MPEAARRSGRDCTPGIGMRRDAVLLARVYSGAIPISAIDVDSPLVLPIARLGFAVACSKCREPPTLSITSPVIGRPALSQPPSDPGARG